MPDDRLVLDLLEEALQSGRSPEDVCAARPDLLDEVRVRLGRLDRVREQLDDLFPEAEQAGDTQPHVAGPGASTPEIPGHDVESVLGRGGMGVVYKARHRRLNRPVAVKMMLSGPYAGPRELARFRREAETLAGLEHPNVVRVHEAGDLDGLPYFTMEFVEGGTLADRLAGVPQPADRAASLVAILAGAIQAAHDLGIVHRDLKPANILMTPDGTPKVSDFGLARRFEAGAALTRTGTRVGTPSYMAPEQAAGTPGAFGPAMDVYALGAILYELLTGRPPFRAETAAETERQVIAEEPAPPSRLNARVPRDLETICLMCLRKDPRRRYATAAALADDLGRFRRGEPVAARPAGPIERARRWARRRPWRASAGLGGLIVAVSMMAGAWWIVADRAATARAAEGDLREAEGALERSAWPEARTAIERARGRLGDRGPGDLRRRLDRAAHALELTARLDAILADFAASVMTRAVETFDSARADRAYSAAFREAGLGGGDEPPGQVAGRIRATGVRRAVVEALDHWATCPIDDRRARWVLDVARLADMDPASAWRDRVRDPAVRGDARALAELARAAPLDGQSVPLHLALARRLKATGGDGLGLLRRIQAAHPGDFWASFALAFELDSLKNPDAIGYFRAALAIRPGSLAALNNLGIALDEQGRVAEATDLRRVAVLLNPDSDICHYNLAISYRVEGRLGLAADHCRRAIRIAPRSGRAHTLLGGILIDAGEFVESRAALLRGLELLAEGDANRAVAGPTLGRCERLMALEPRLAGVVLGTDRPTAAEGVEFAELSARKRRYAQAARLYSAAFDDPRAAEDLQFHHRHEAARAAARAGVGWGEGAPPDSPARAALRGKALAWLGADRDVWAFQLNRRDAEARRVATQTLRRWLRDEALAGVRDEALDRLDGDERQRWRALWAGLEALAAGDSPPILDPARALAARGDWKLAAEGYARIFAMSPTDDGHAWFEYAAVQLLSGDRDGYRRTCARLLERGPGTTATRPYHVARACTLAPDAVDDPGRPTRLAAAELARHEARFWSLTEQAALRHRAGRPVEAVPLLERSLAANPRPGARVLNWLWLSLACQRLGRAEEASSWLAMAVNWLDRPEASMPSVDEAKGFDLHNWLEAQVLRREAGSPPRSSIGKD